MPELSAEDGLVLDYVSTWYSTHRGALRALDVATAVDLPPEQVVACAGVLAAAGHVRTYPSSDGAHDVAFVGMVSTGRRTIDVTGAPTGPPAAPADAATAPPRAGALA